MTVTSLMTDQFTLADETTCPVCPILIEAIAIIEQTTEALEEGHHTMQVIARARRFLAKARHQPSR